MTAPNELSRREFIKVFAVSGVGLVISIYLSGCKDKVTTPLATDKPITDISPSLNPTDTPSIEGESTLAPQTEVDEISPSVYVTITKENRVVITIPRSELGQGPRTALAMILAEELNANWSQVDILQAPADGAYGDQSTGGSTSIQMFYLPFRQAGAIARDLFINAAAKVWSVEPKTCYAEGGAVYHSSTSRTLTYGELTSVAANLPVPPANSVALKDPEDFKIIGTSIPRVDNPDIVSGKAVYGLDIRLPGMLYATVARCPVPIGSVSAFDPTKAKAVPGVKDVVEILGGVGVVAESTWAAIQGRKALQVTWDEGQYADINSSEIEVELVRSMDIPPAEGELSALYVFPYYSHATMEPMNCTAYVQGDTCEIWVPTQSPQDVQKNVAQKAKIPRNNIRVNVTMVGGGFGRRLEWCQAGWLPPACDYALQATLLSQAVNAPVQVFWTREDDFYHDLYHPISATRVTAGLDDISTIRLNYREPRPTVPTGAWRSVTNPPEAFAHECFMDEYATATGVDPLELRRQVLSGRALAVVELAAEKAGWGNPLPAGVGRGLAYHATWDVTHVAQVAEVSIESGNQVRVQRVVCAVDCGQVINPDIVRAQIEGGIIFGMTAALKQEITFENGRAQQTNMRDYPLLRFSETPSIEVYLVNNNERPTGIGEMGNPPIAPAIANALYTLTGKRIRRLPISL